MNTWIQTHSGKRVDLPNPKLEQILIEDIAYSLSMKCRFNGHTNKFYSVAEHSMRVSYLVEARLRLGALLHDANEAYLPDIPRPVKDLIPEYKEIEDSVQSAIYEKFCISLTEEDEKLIKKADNIMLATEGRDLVGDTQGWVLPELPKNTMIYPYGLRIEKLFMVTFEIYNEERFNKDE